MSLKQMQELNPDADKHSTAAIIRIALKNHFDNPLLFTTVRDPYARAVSMWRQFVEVHLNYIDKNAQQGAYQTHNIDVVKRYSNGKIGFKRFLDETPPWHWHPKNHPSPEDCIWNGWWPQTKWVCNKDGKVIVDKIFYVNDLKAIEDWLIKYNIRFIHDMRENVRNLADPIQMYDTDMLNIVNNLFYDDFELFGFTRYKSNG